MINAAGKKLGVLAALCVLLGIAWFPAAARSDGAAINDAATRERILRYIREKFGVAESVKMALEPWREFSYPAFYATSVVADNGKQKQTQNVFLSKDQRYLIVGNLYTLGADPTPEIIQHVHELFKVPQTSNVTVGPFRNSAFPNMYATTITVDDGKQKAAQDFYVTKDRRCLVLGTVFNLGLDPRLEALRTLAVQNQPSQGPPSAPVTIVEFSDFQCPMCARVHEFLEKELLPRYRGKVRLVFKEFPLVAIHDWSLTAAIASQCVYQINPEAFAPFRSLVFQNQGTLNLANLRDLLLSYGEQAGVDRVKLAGCLDAKAALPRVEQNALEGKRLGIQSTPTSFVNGKMIVGMPSVDAFYSAVDEALRAAK